MSSLPIGELLALLVAFIWGSNALWALKVVKVVGVFRYHALRLLYTSIALIIFITFFIGWELPKSGEAYFFIVLSAFLGIFLGDACLYMCSIRIGPRKANSLFAMKVPLSVILGWLFLAEKLSFIELLAVFLIFYGVLMAVLYGPVKKNNHSKKWENTDTNIALSCIFGFLAAFFQATAMLVMKPVLMMEDGNDPLVISAMRIIFATLFYYFCLALPFKIFKSRFDKIPYKINFLIGIQGIYGLGIGATLMIIALKYGELGIILSLESTSPLFITILSSLFLKYQPSLKAWVGVILIVIGTVILFNF